MLKGYQIKIKISSLESFPSPHYCKANELSVCWFLTWHEFHSFSRTFWEQQCPIIATWQAVDFQMSARVKQETKGGV